MKHTRNNNTLIFIGIQSNRSEATNGEVVKNQLLINRFKDVFSEVHILDLYKFKSRVLIISMRLLYLLIRYPSAKIVLSASSKVANRFIRLFYLINKSNVYYWVVGGAFADMLVRGEFNPKHYTRLHRMLVQSEKMLRTIKYLGVNQVELIRNAKPISYIPAKPSKTDQDNLIKFVFISRISPRKGCDYIFEAVNRLNEEGYVNKYSVTFYGKIEDGYNSFMSSIRTYKNTYYEGFLDLQDSVSYNVLASYDTMLFPTFWEGEGFAGIFIDAFIAGIPVICSDWNCNSEIIDENVGCVIPTHDVASLVCAMKRFINGESDIRKMSSNCQQRALDYDIKSVLNIDYLRQIGLLSNIECN